MVPEFRIIFENWKTMMGLIMDNIQMAYYWHINISIQI